MKSPQLANGYTPIANELLEHLIAYKFTQNDYKVLLAIIRKTYGYHKKTDAIGNSQLAVMTGLQRTHVARSIRSLVAQNILICDDSQYKNSIGINKYYQTWGIPDLDNLPVKTDLQTVTNLVTDTTQDCDQIGLNAVTNLVTLNAKNCDQNGHTQKKVKDSIKKTLPPPLYDPLHDNIKNGFSSRGLNNSLLLTESNPTPAYPLIFPKALRVAEQTAAENLLRHCPENAQELLDVLAATLKAGKVQTSALAFLGALIRRHQAGSFDPTPGLKIKLDRERDVVHQQKIVTHIVVDKETQRQNMANFLANTNLRLSNRDA